MVDPLKRYRLVTSDIGGNNMSVEVWNYVPYRAKCHKTKVPHHRDLVRTLLES